MRDLNDLVCPCCGREDLLPIDVVDEGLVLACAICEHEWVLGTERRERADSDERLFESVEV